MPIALSYDHRVLDGASRRASPPTSCPVLSDIRKIIL
jgi:pyruvate/2-oxoglutarate dehydrogenase complex dihydrolipoamide acyltransferase (E2) component